MADTKYAVKSGFYDSVNRDRLYSADDMNQPYKEILTEGIDAGGFEVTPQSTPNMTVNVAAGHAFLGGKWVDAVARTLTVPENTAMYGRYDAVVLQVDTNSDVREASIVYRTGTPAAIAEIPALINTGGISEVMLAYITVAAGATSISTSYIHDTRGGANCPYADIKLGQLVREQQITDDVTSWLAAHVDPVGSAVVVDNTLSIEGAAADAKATGDALANLNNDLGQLRDAFSVPITNTSAGNVNIKFGIVAGRTYKIENHTGYTCAVYTKTQANVTVETITDSLGNGKTKTFTAQSDAYKLIIYGRSDGTGYVTFEDMSAIVPTMQTDISTLSANTTSLQTQANDLDKTIKKDPFVITDWEQGNFYTNGNKYNTTKVIRTANFVTSHPAVYIKKSGYKLQVFGWDGDTCQGIWQGNSFSSVNTYLKEINFDLIGRSIGDYKYKITITREDGEDISVSEASDALGYYNFIPRDGEHRRCPRLTFIDDDCYAQSLTIWEDIAQTANIPVTLACITNSVGNTGMATWERIERLANRDFEFVSHTHNHISLNDNDVPEETIEADFASTIQALREHYCESGFLVYPYTLITTRNKALVEKYFNLGFGLGNAINTRPIVRPEMHRYDINEGTKVEKTIDGQTVMVYPFKSLETIKGYINKCLRNNGWIVFMSHLRNTYGDGYYYDNDVKQLILDIVAYARSLGFEISTVRDAYTDYRDIITY